MTLIHGYDKLDRAVEFCWETQRALSAARFQNWPYQRLRAYIDARKQLWRRFPAGVRTSAHNIFMEQLNEQLTLGTGQRDKNKPVWLNEQLGMQSEQPDTGSAAPGITTALGDTGNVLLDAQSREAVGSH